MTLSIYQYQTGDYRQAYRSNNSWAHGSADISQSLLTHPGTKQLTEYYMLQNEINQKNSELKQLYITIITIAAILAIAILAIVTLKLFKSKKKLEIKCYEMQEKLDALKADLNHTVLLKNKLSSAKINQSFKNLLEKELETVNKIIFSIYELPESFKNKNTIFENKFNIILSDFTADSTLQSIETIINGIDNNWMSNFRASYPTLPRNDYSLVIYLYLGYSTKTISLLMRKSEGAIHSSKYNLKKRLCNNDDYTREVRARLCLSVK